MFKNKLFILIAILTIIGSFLRLYNIRHTLMFLGDQGRDAIVVRRLLVNFDPILIGPTTSVGKIQLGPLYYYFMAPWLLLFNYDPVGPAIGVALIGIITIPVLFLVLRRMLSTPPAIIGASLYTFSPVVIEFTRFSWNPNPMPIVIILLLWSQFEAYQHNSVKHIFLSWALFAIALHLHYMVLLISPMLALSWALIVKNSNQRKLAIRYWLYGLGTFLLLMSPLLIFDLRHDFINYQGFVEFFQKGHHSPRGVWETIKGMEGRMQQSIGQIIGFQYAYSVRNLISWMIVLIFGLIFWIRKKDKVIQIIGMYLFFSVFGLALFSGDVFIHYLGFVFPLGFFLISIIASMIWKVKEFSLKVVAVTLTIILIVWNIAQHNYLKPIGWQIDDMKLVAAKIHEDIQGEMYNITAKDDTNDYRAMNYRYFLEMMGSKPLETTDYSSAQVLYLISQRPVEDIKNIETWELESFLDLSDQSKNSEINAKITNEWQFEGGPWVYRIDKSI